MAFFQHIFTVHHFHQPHTSILVRTHTACITSSPSKVRAPHPHIFTHGLNCHIIRLSSSLTFLPHSQHCSHHLGHHQHSQHTAGHPNPSAFPGTRGGRLNFFKFIPPTFNFHFQTIQFIYPSIPLFKTKFSPSFNFSQFCHSNWGPNLRNQKKTNSKKRLPIPPRGGQLGWFGVALGGFHFSTLFSAVPQGQLHSGGYLI